MPKQHSLSLGESSTPCHLPLFPVGPVEKLHVEYFQAKTVPQLARGLEVDFWGRSALHILTTEPIVWHAALAVSVVHQNYLSSESNALSADRDYSFALHHYDKAIGLLIRLQEQDIARNLVATLTSCVLFICFEVCLHGKCDVSMLLLTLQILRNDTVTAISHIRGGMKILSEKVPRSLLGQTPDKVKETSMRDDSAEIDALRLLFARLEYQASFFNCEASSNAASSVLNKEDSVLDCTATYFDPSQMLSAPHPFESASLAQAYLDCLTHDNMRLVPLANISMKAHDVDTIKKWKEDCLGEIACFNVDAAARMQLQAYFPSGLSKTSAVSMLKVRELCAEILQACAHYGSEMTFDECLPRFKDVIERLTVLVAPRPRLVPTRTGAQLVEADDDRQLSQPGFGLRSEVNIPLFIVAWKCRDPLLRRRAIDLLRARRSREGLWDSSILATTAEHIVMVEEQGRNELRVCSDIPDDARVDSIGFIRDRGKQGVFVSLGHARGQNQWQKQTPISLG